MEYVYLVHKVRGGKPTAIKAAVYNKNPMLFGGEGWRQATMEEIKKYNFVEPEPPKKKATKKKKEVKED